MGVVLNLGSSRRRDECYIPVISPALFSSHMAPWTKLSTDTQVSCRDRLIKQTPGAGPPPPWGRPHNPKLPANPGRLFSGLMALVLHHRRPGRSPRQDLHTHPKKPTSLLLPAHIPPSQPARRNAPPRNPSNRTSAAGLLDGDTTSAWPLGVLLCNMTCPIGHETNDGPRFCAQARPELGSFFSPEQLRVWCPDHDLRVSVLPPPRLKP